MTLCSTVQQPRKPKSCSLDGSSGEAAPPSTVLSKAASITSRALLLSVATVVGYLHEPQKGLKNLTCRASFKEGRAFSVQGRDKQSLLHSRRITEEICSHHIIVRMTSRNVHSGAYSFEAVSCMLAEFQHKGNGPCNIPDHPQNA